MPNLLRLLVSLFALLTVLAHARNFTIDDTHPDIRYSPLTAWRGHGESPPDSELQRTWHHGINVSKRRCLVYDRSQRRSCVDTPVILSFKFIGSAIYLFASSNPISATINVTYTINNTPISNNQQPSPSTSSILVFSHDDLPETTHQFQVIVQEGSEFSFDYLIYTQSERSTADLKTQPSQRRSAGNAVSRGTDDEDTSHSKNVATFAGAIGGSVGVLFLVSACLAASIIRRRRRTRQRLNPSNPPEDSNTSSLFTNGSHDRPPPMQGPAPFVPRYFPGTVLLEPLPPPPYESRRSSTSTLQALTPGVPNDAGEAQRSTRVRSRVESYDRPPRTPSPDRNSILHREAVIDEVASGRAGTQSQSNTSSKPTLSTSEVDGTGSVVLSSQSGVDSPLTHPPGLSTGSPLASS